MPLAEGGTNYIQNRDTLQTGSSFYVEVGTATRFVQNGWQVVDMGPSSPTIISALNIGPRRISPIEGQGLNVNGTAMGQRGQIASFKSNDNNSFFEISMTGNSSPDIVLASPGSQNRNIRIKTQTASHSMGTGGTNFMFDNINDFHIFNNGKLKTSRIEAFGGAFSSVAFEASRLVRVLAIQGSSPTLTISALDVNSSSMTINQSSFGWRNAGQSLSVGTSGVYIDDVLVNYSSMVAVDLSGFILFTATAQIQAASSLVITPINPRTGAQFTSLVPVQVTPYNNGLTSNSVEWGAWSAGATSLTIVNNAVASAANVFYSFYANP